MGIEMLKLHWKAARWPMLPVLIAAFAMPLMAGRSAWGGTYGETSIGSGGVWAVVNDAAGFALTFPLLAIVSGTILGLTAWNWDHRHNHIYPLSLPIARWRYAAMKFGSGVILLGATSGVFFAGAALSAGLAQLPVGLNAYPAELSVHFFLASLTGYALLFALAGGTMKTAVAVISLSMVALFFGNGLFDLGGVFWAPLARVDVPSTLYLFLVEGNGPFSVFAGNWMLFDV
jgi:hypothetical protein